MTNTRILLVIFTFFFSYLSFSQSYFYKEYAPFNENIPSPEEFLEYGIGDYHTRHDLVVAYITKLSELSNNAILQPYGKTNENRKLINLVISSQNNLKNLENLKEKHLQVVHKDIDIKDFSDLPIFINLGYNVHGNEPSGTEAALLTAYVLLASENPKVKEYLKEAIIFLDPVINPDGRDRHTNWVNTFKGSPLIADKYDIEHNEAWPRGRTNHYWFDLNRDLLLAVQPESNAKLNWYHEWYPNVVTDFHEMGTNSTFFFEPKQLSASLTPVTPIENYTVLNNAFAKFFTADLDKIKSLYFTKEKYDATYPGYGSTYGDLHGSLSLLFEQASSRGHVQETPTGNITFKFTIRNQFVTSFSTIKAAISNKELLYSYQNNFFKSSIEKASESKIKGYVFGDDYDKNINKSFIDLLLKHKIKVYDLEDDIIVENKKYRKDKSYFVPTKQAQYLMVRTMFETYNKYRDSVFYDASSWSLANFYNMNYSPLKKIPQYLGELTSKTNKITLEKFSKSNYAYLISWDDYYAPAILNYLHNKGVIVKTATKPFKVSVKNSSVQLERGSLLIAVGIQNVSEESLYTILKEASEKFKIDVNAVKTGFSLQGIDLGSSNFITLEKPKAMMLVEGGVSAYEAGEVWHLLEQRMQMPISKIPERIFYRTDLRKYNVIIMVSGYYNLLNEKSRQKIRDWVAQGNTLITIRTASSWAIRNKLVKEKLVVHKNSEKDSLERLNYGESREHLGRNSIGGAIFKVDLDITHPIGYGYHNRELPVYKNNRVWLAPSKNKFSTVAKYTKNPHIDGYVTKENLDNYFTQSASIIVNQIGKGRVVMFADNPNFRGAWYGTNKLFMNAIFFGSIISIP
ncbi:zinc carboxypeptidase [Polaribacter reichenbachii]|uniref:Zinc carboxypeptidase n=1 Tax=Polaribacter reichenbachii TaxID=996801 RepID=A0A1B8U4L5_9FLAO|nr:M14 family zinc carboxypeptidase [Polaribacter reichenbachii]APZ44830.1 zinc carboxypeptidase [Polaribacter reichenbachii]AUC18694.1 zinc carboxypeptidase [Polaribacter reichenbachii]OBY66807.1 zinc carboxypeptidase [Polaribacter reichenbachii]